MRSIIREKILTTLDNHLFRSTRKEKRDTPTKKRLLILRKDYIGDVILFYPTLKIYREHFKDYEIDIVVDSKNHGLFPLLHKYVDNIIEFNPEAYRTYPYRRKFIANLYTRNYDIALYPVFSREAAGDAMIRSTQARERISFNGDTLNMHSGLRDKNNSLYTKLVPDEPVPQKDFEKNIFFANEVCGTKETISFPTISGDDLQKGPALPPLYCVIFPGAAKAYKMWPPRNYADICKLIASYGITPIICGTAGENHLAKEIASHLSKTSWINLCGKTNLLELGTVLKNACFYFGNDTGVAHLSVAVGTPTFCILGGGTFDRFFPYGDLQKNIPIYNHDIQCKNDGWACAARHPRRAAPCVESITVSNATLTIEPHLKLYSHEQRRA